MQFYFKKRCILRDYFLVDFYEEPLSLLPECCHFKAKKKMIQDEMIDEEDEETLEILPLKLGRPSNIDDYAHIHIKMDDHNYEDVTNIRFSGDNLNKPENRKSKWKIYWRRFESFTQSPKVHFFYDTIFYATFLLMFSYMLLCDFNYYKLVDEDAFYNQENSTLDSVASFNKSQEFISALKVVQLPSFIEYLVTFWIISFFFEELNQVTLI